MENEIKKCLLCKNALCRTCPAGTKIPEVIALVRQGKKQEAGAILFDNNPLSAITGEVCPNHLYCHGTCVLNKRNNAVNFGRIEREISTKYLDNPCITPKSQPIETAKRIAIVGSGPAGIALSYYLQKEGNNVTVFEKQPKFGGMLRYGIPSFRLDKTLIDKIISLIESTGVNFVNNFAVNLDYLDQLKSRFDIIVLAIGSGISKILDAEGVNHATYALDYLKNPTPAKNILVLGAGNVAIDCALTAAHLGAKSVNLCYRRDEAAMKAYPEELELARSKGIIFNYHMIPKKITAQGVTFDQNQNEVFMPADKVIIAIGQTATKNGLIEAKDFQTKHTNVYAIGDAITGTSTIIKAVASAQQLAKILINKI